MLERLEKTRVPVRDATKSVLLGLKSLLRFGAQVMLWLLFFAVTVISGCSSASQQDAAPAQKAQPQPEEAPASTCLARYDCPLDTRNGLSSVLLYAATHASEVRGARSGVAAAQSDVDTANWNFYPTPYASYVDSNNSSDDELQAGLDQTLWAGGQLRTERKIAQTGKVRAEFLSSGTQRDVVFATLDRFGDLFAAYYRREAWAKAAAAQADIVDTVAHRKAEGFASEGDLTMAQARVGVTSAKMDSLATELEVARAGLARYFPKDVPDALIRNTRPVPLKAVPQIKRVIDTTPEVQTARTDVTRAQLRAKQDQAAALPRLYLRLGQNFDSNSGGNDQALSVGLQTRFGGGLSLFSKRRRSEAQIAQAEAGVEAARGEMGVKVQQLSAVAASSQRQEVSYANLVKQAQVLVESYKRQFVSGAKTWNEVMNAEGDLAEYEGQRAAAQAAYVIASWKLAYYLDGPDFLEQIR